MFMSGMPPGMPMPPGMAGMPMPNMANMQGMFMPPKKDDD
jgi:hypothetical protein